MFFVRPFLVVASTSTLAVSLLVASQGAFAQKAPDAPVIPATAPTNPAKVPTGPATPLDLAGIHNAFQWTDKIISGSCPAGEAGFKALAAQGVKTIITVDGAKPDVALAKKYGMRYVHIPVEYSGITKVDAIRIARAVRDLPGPVFIHCHHGIHRGPAATALAAIAVAKFTNEEALAGLKQAGTGVNYQGLWKNVREFQAPTQAEIDAADNSFPEVGHVEALAEHMVHIDERWANLGDVKAAGWKAPPTNPDVDPAHEALMLREGFMESARSPEAKKFPADFMKKMGEAEAAALALETALRDKNNTKAALAFDTVKATCGSCHKLYRDNKPE